MHPIVDSTKWPTAHTPGTYTHRECLTFLIYLLFLASQSCDTSKHSRTQEATMLQCTNSPLGHGSSWKVVSFLCMASSSGRCSLGTGCRSFPVSIGPQIYSCLGVPTHWQ